MPQRHDIRGDKNAAVEVMKTGKKFLAGLAIVLFLSALAAEKTFPPQKRINAMTGDEWKELSHYKPPEAMAREDKRTLAVLTDLKPFAARAVDADARRAASLVLALFRDMGAELGEMLEHTDSSVILGERTESGTSYATITYRLAGD
jgi:hypothetical protein